MLIMVIHLIVNSCTNYSITVIETTYVIITFFNFNINSLNPLTTITKYFTWIY